jgi:hypothetical protein
MMCVHENLDSFDPLLDTRHSLALPHATVVTTDNATGV